MMRGQVVVLGVGEGDPDAAHGADRLAEADHVLVAPEVESAVLFYAEAWRVERVEPGAAVRVVGELLALDGPCAVALAVAGDPTTDPAWRAVVDGLRVAVEAEVTAVPGVAVVPPRLSPLW
jgi:precorrin-2 methylase